MTFHDNKFSNKVFFPSKGVFLMSYPKYDDLLIRPPERKKPISVQEKIENMDQAGQEPLKRIQEESNHLCKFLFLQSFH